MAPGRRQGLASQVAELRAAGRIRTEPATNRPPAARPARTEAEQEIFIQAIVRAAARAKRWALENFGR